MADPTPKQAPDTSTPGDGGLAAFISSATTYTFVGVIVIFLFCLVRKRYPCWYEPRCRSETFLQKKQRRIAKRPDAPRPGFTGWLKSTIALTDDEIFDSAGLDALMYIKFFEFGMKLFTVASLFGLCVLLPINATSDPETDDGDEPQEGLDDLSLANIPEESQRLWWHAVMCWVYAAVAYYLLYRIYRQYIVFRQRHMQRAAHSHVSLSILVQNIDTEKYPTSDAVARFYRELYPATFRSAWLAQPVKEITEKLEERQKAVDGLEHAYAALVMNEASDDSDVRREPRPRHKVKMWHCRKVDTIEYHQGELDRLNDEIAQLQLAHDADALPSAFVTFSDTYTSTACCHLDHGTQPYEFITSQAPEPRDVYWPNLRFRQPERTLRGIVIAAATFWLVLFWVIPVGMVASLANLEEISEKVSFLSWIRDVPDSVQGFLSGVLPTLALLLFNILLPLILRIMSKIEGVEAESWLDMAVMKKFFYFQIFNNFLIFSVASSVSDQLSGVIDHPTSIVTLLGTSMPKVASFFINFLMLNTFTVFPLQLLDPATLIVGELKRKFLVKTVRERMELESATPPEYGKTFSRHILMFVVGYSYAAMAPLILPFATLFFTFGWIVSRYRAMWVYIPLYETGGQMWPIAFARIIAGMITGQITMLGVMGLKKVPGPSAMLLPLPFITYAFYLYMQNGLLHRSSYLSADSAFAVDKELLAAGDNDNEGDDDGGKSSSSSGKPIVASSGGSSSSSSGIGIASPYSQEELVVGPGQPDLHWMKGGAGDKYYRRWRRASSIATDVKAKENTKANETTKGKSSSNSSSSSSSSSSSRSSRKGGKSAKRDGKSANKNDDRDGDGDGDDDDDSSDAGATGQDDVRLSISPLASSASRSSGDDDRDRDVAATATATAADDVGDVAGGYQPPAEKPSRTP